MKTDSIRRTYAVYNDAWEVVGRTSSQGYKKAIAILKVESVLWTNGPAGYGWKDAKNHTWSRT